MENALAVLRSPPVVRVVRALCMTGSVTLMLSGTPDVLATLTGKSPADPSKAPVYATMALDNGVGLWFSSLLGDALGFRLRVAGSLLNLLYATVLAVKVHGGARGGVTRAFAAAAMAFGAMYLTLKASVPEDHHMNVLGLINTCTAISFAASPLANVGSVLRLGDASSISLPMSGALLLTATSWALYGLILGNTWMVLPNVLNAILAALQVGLVLRYPGPGLTTAATTPRGTHVRAWSEVSVSPSVKDGDGGHKAKKAPLPGPRARGKSGTTGGSTGPRRSPTGRKDKDEEWLPEGPAKQITAMHRPGQTPVEVPVVGSPALAALRRTTVQAGRAGISTTHMGAASAEGRAGGKSRREE